ncbi:type-2 ice-structuring protein-like isoform X2 [Siniperca chuatsi]|uniref:type-2 ice-structuring protein-like isoform X2 n=1 Tax=Siniperca chuatsi TaxID=119488 RepID=UPI001CE058AA|nr:type-2 ice-structuring protein-like isoform X2 [Siniperca chuatsi]
MLTVSLLVCAMMALTRANGEDTSINGTVTNDTNIDVLNARNGCPPGWEPFDGRCFKLVTSRLTWAKAEKNCQAFGGNLASTRNSEDYNFIQQMTTELTWIGGSACQETNAWFWSDGTPMDKPLWCAGQPDGALAQCCLQINTGDGKCWDDQPCRNLLPSVCIKK